MNKLLANHDTKQTVALLAVVVIGFLLLVVIASFTYHTFPTIQEANTQILIQYPECRDQLEVAIVTQNYGFTGPLLYPITGYFLECHAVNISIRIQKPE